MLSLGAKLVVKKLDAARSCENLHVPVQFHNIAVRSGVRVRIKQLDVWAENRHFHPMA